VRLDIDIRRLGDDFLQKCDRSYIVWTDYGTGRSAVTRLNPAGGAYTQRYPPKCCEEAFNLALPLSASDCRSFRLMSVQGTVIRTPSGFGALNAPITLPGVTPIVLPAVSLPTSQQESGMCEIW
jgi:hypothetical protein